MSKITRKQAIEKSIKEISESAKVLQKKGLSKDEYYSNSFELIKSIFFLLDDLYFDDFNTEIDLLCLLVAMNVLSMKEPNTLPFFSGIANHCLAQARVERQMHEPPENKVPYLDLTTDSGMPKA